MGGSRFVHRVADIPVRLDEQTPRIAAQHGEFDGELRFRVGEMELAIADNHHGSVSPSGQFSRLQNAAAFIVAAQHDDSVSLDGRSVVLKKGTGFTKDGSREQPEYANATENYDEKPQLPAQRSSPELRGSMWPTVFRRKYRRAPLPRSADAEPGDAAEQAGGRRPCRASHPSTGGREFHRSWRKSPFAG